MAVVHIINKQTSKDPTIMKFVRQFVLPILKYNIIFKALHIKGAKNNAVDQLSRLQIHQFRKDFPFMNSTPELVSLDLLEI